MPRLSPGDSARLASNDRNVPVAYAIVIEQGDRANPLRFATVAARLAQSNIDAGPGERPKITIDAGDDLYVLHPNDATGDAVVRVTGTEEA